MLFSLFLTSFYSTDNGFYWLYRFLGGKVHFEDKGRDESWLCSFETRNVHSGCKHGSQNMCMRHKCKHVFKCVCKHMSWQVCWHVWKHGCYHCDYNVFKMGVNMGLKVGLTEGVNLAMNMLVNVGIKNGWTHEGQHLCKCVLLYL